MIMIYLSHIILTKQCTESNRVEDLTQGSSSNVSFDGDTLFLVSYCLEYYIYFLRFHAF